MIEWQKRVLEERDQLKAKIVSLIGMLQTYETSSTTLTSTDIELLKNQLVHMQGYISVLHSRIARFM